MKRTHGKWIRCEFCFMVHLENSKHKCPEGVLAKRHIEIDEEVGEIMNNFDLSLHDFWNDPHTQFDEYLADEGEI